MERLKQLLKKIESMFPDRYFSISYDVNCHVDIMTKKRRDPETVWTLYISEEGSSGMKEFPDFNALEAFVNGMIEKKNEAIDKAIMDEVFK